MPLPQGLPRPELGRHVPPRAARAEPPSDRFENFPMITPRTTPTTSTTGQRRLHQLPQLVTDHTRSDHRLILDQPTPNLCETRPSLGAGRVRGDAQDVHTPASVFRDERASLTPVARTPTVWVSDRSVWMSGRAGVPRTQQWQYSDAGNGDLRCPEPTRRAPRPRPGGARSSP